MKKLPGSETEPTLKSADAISRRKMLGGAAIAGVGAVCFMSTSASAKVAQKDAQYQSSPKDGAKCGTCSQFVAPDSCNVVDGKVSENGWCQFYAKKG